MTSQFPPQRGAAFTFDFCLIDSATGQIRSAPTIAAGDFKISKDGGALTNLTNTPTASGVLVTVVLTLTEMTVDRAVVVWRDAAGAEWDDGYLILMTSTVLMDDIPTAAEIADKLLGRNLAGGSDGGRDVTGALRALRNKRAVVAGTLTVYEEDDATPAWNATINTSPGDPVTSIDPS